MPDTIYPSEIINFDLINIALKGFLEKIEQNIAIQTEILQGQLHQLQKEPHTHEIQSSERKTSPESKKSKGKAKSKRPFHPSISEACQSQNNAYDGIYLSIPSNAKQIELLIEDLESLNAALINLIKGCGKQIPELAIALAEAINKENIYPLYDNMLKFAEENSANRNDLIDFYRGFLPKFNLDGDLEQKFPNTKIVYFNTHFDECPLDSKYNSSLKLYIKQVFNKERGELIKAIIQQCIDTMKNSGIYTLEQVTAQAIIFFWFLCNRNFNITLFRAILNTNDNFQDFFQNEYFDKIKAITNYLNDDTNIDDLSKSLIEQISKNFNEKKALYTKQYYTPSEVVYNSLVETLSLPERLYSATRPINDRKISEFTDFMLKLIHLFMQAQKEYDENDAKQQDSLQSSASHSHGPIASCSHATNADNAPARFINNTSILDYLSSSTRVEHGSEILLIARPFWDKFVGKRDNDGFFRRNEQQEVNAKLLNDYLTLSRHEIVQQLYNNWHQLLGEEFPHLKTKADELRTKYQDTHPDSMVCRPQFVLPMASLPTSPRSSTILPHSLRAACSSEGTDLASTPSFFPRAAVPVEPTGVSDEILSTPSSPKTKKDFFATRGGYKNTPPPSVMRTLQRQTTPTKDAVSKIRSPR